MNIRWTPLLLPALLSASISSAMPLPAPVLDVAYDGVISTTFTQALYVFDPDQGQAAPRCEGACAEKWPPLVITADEASLLEARLPAQLRGRVGTIQRANGLTQLTVDGRPVYAYFADRTSQDRLGDGLGGVWHVVH